MRRALALYRSSIGKKVTMAITGLVLFFFVIAHMLGNLKVFQGPEKFNAYAEFLREFGEPLLGHSQFLWILRVGLLLAVVLHIVAAVQLTRMSQQARPVRYQRRLTPSASTYASRTMRWGGVIIATFVVYHLLHLTVGTVHPDFVAGSVYHNVVVGFRSWIVTLAYIAAMGVLGLHLYHGVWSTFQTLGAGGAEHSQVRRSLAAGVALVIFLGFITVPVSVLTGVVQ